MNYLISVIVPVYKVEKYLNKCIDSIINQTYKNLEIILIDDGSPDGCPEICDNYKKKDSRIKVIHTKNKGAGHARNQGIREANGDFISFIDSDDYISPLFYEYLIGLFNENIDIVECGYIDVYDDSEIFESKESYMENEYSKFEAMREHITDHIFRQLIWNKLYRKKTINSIFFPEGKKIDDEFWTYKIIGNSRKLISSSRKLYGYRQQKDSVMHNVNSISRLQAVDAKSQRHDYILTNIPNLKSESSYSLWLSCLYHGQLILRTLNEREANKYLDYLLLVLNNNSIVFDYKKITLKNRIWIYFSKVNFKFTCKLRNKLNIGC